MAKASVRKGNGKRWTRVEESRVADASPGLAHASTVRHDVKVENRSVHECTVYLEVTASARHVPLAYSCGNPWKDEREFVGPVQSHDPYARFREDLDVGSPGDLAMLPYDEDLNIATSSRRQGSRAPVESGERLTHTLNIT